MFSTIKGLTALVALTLIAAAGPAQAEQSKTFGDYTVHYNAVNTEFLTPSIAKSYNIKRSKNRALLTVSILKKDGSLIGQPTQATVSGRATNLSQQVKNFKLREIQESDAIYYIADFQIADKETLDFTIKIKTSDGPEETVAFRQQFFTN